jgi:hypothetical protein
MTRNVNLECTQIGIHRLESLCRPHDQRVKFIQAGEPEAIAFRGCSLPRGGYGYGYGYARTSPFWCASTAPPPSAVTLCAARKSDIALSSTSAPTIPISSPELSNTRTATVIPSAEEVKKYTGHSISVAQSCVLLSTRDALADRRCRRAGHHV